jgi:hypothetical protein
MAVTNTLELSFHNERTQPLSDLVKKRAADFYLICDTPLEAYVSVMTSRGLSHFDRVTLCGQPYKLPYEQPLGVDWSVLQIQPLKPRSYMHMPYNIKLKYSYT